MCSELLELLQETFEWAVCDLFSGAVLNVYGRSNFIHSRKRKL